MVMRILIGLSAMLAAETMAAPPHPGEAPYRRVCFGCHDKGIEIPNSKGAPRLGNLPAWEPLRKRGIDSLVSSVINPAPGRFVMPRGELSDSEVRAAVDYMLQQADPRAVLQNMGERRGMPVLD